MSKARLEDSLQKHPFLFYISRHKKMFALGLLSLLLTNSLDALPPLLIGHALDAMTGSSEHSMPVALWSLAGVLVGLSFFRFCWRFFWGRFHHSVAEDLRNRIYNQFTLMSPSYFQKNRIGELMSYIINDVNAFRMGIGPGILILADSIFILFVVPPLMLSISVPWTWKTLIFMPVVPFLVRRSLRLIFARYKDQQDRFSEVSGVAQEIVSGIRVIKSFKQEVAQTLGFNFVSKKLEMAANSSAKIDAAFAPQLEMSVTVGSVILLLIGAPDVWNGTVTVGSFFAFYQYVQRMVWPMEGIGLSLSQIQQGKASFKRIVDLLLTKPDVEDEGDEVAVEQFHKLEVRDLTFTYPGHSTPALRNVSFNLHAGETLGIVGTTGSGKTTLIDLLCRFYPAPANTIFINDIPIEKIQVASVRRLFGVCPQEAFLFSEKVVENLRFARDEASMEEIRLTTELVNVDREIGEIPQGYDGYLGERGVNLSGGQKQRITMARALMRKSPVTILDDSMSAVDANTEQKIMQSLKQQLQNTTAILISHKLSTFKWADRILVLNAGHVEGFGTAREVHEQSPTYKKLASIQGSVNHALG